MPKPIFPVDATRVRVAVVTMASHLAGAFAKAEQALRAEIPGLELSLHPAEAWGSDSGALAACHADIARADIVIVTMLFLEDHIRAVQPAIAARRSECDAVVCMLSAGEVVRLTRMGRFDMAAQRKGPMALLQKLRGGRGDGRSSGQGQMKMLRRLPQLLRFIPGSAQDMRDYFLSLQYWLAGSAENLANLIRLLVNKYANGPRGHLAGALRVGVPVVYPDTGLYHPRTVERIFEDPRHLPPARTTTSGTVGVLVMRSYVLAGNARHYDAVIAALEARGLRVIPAFASGLDARPAIERYFLRDGRSCVDVVVSLTGFSLVGGPAYNDARGAAEILARLDVPYIAAHALEFQTLGQWQADARGLTPIEATMMVAIPELDGAIWPMTFGGRESGIADGPPRMIANEERVTALAGRVARLVALRRSGVVSRRLAIVIFGFPPNSGSTGTAAYLSVFESLFNTLRALAAAGYQVDLPDSVETLRRLILDGNAGRYGTHANVALRVPTDDHVRREPWLAEIERQWGPAPGRQQADGTGIFVLGAQFGNVFVGVQPAFGFEGDPMRLLFERSFAPTHAFSAFYRWIREDFGAHAVLHFGTHGALEFMPGKQAGMSGTCWPDRLIGDLPNFYFYASNNPSEGALAKRRSGAALISHLTPPIAYAGLYRGLADLKATIDRWRAMPPDEDSRERADVSALVQAQAFAIDLAVADPPWGRDAPKRIADLSARLLEIEYSLIPSGLHVIGMPPNPAQRASILDAAGIADTGRRAELDSLLAVDYEIPALLHALNGGFLRPAPGGDLLRTPEILPTGRNLHGFDPFRIPSAYAIQDGAKQAERLLARHVADTGVIPETIAMVLWGTDNLKSEGGPIAQALWLMGATPRHDSYGRVCGARLLPLDELGRPRVDVVVTLSGIFRDLLPLQTKLLAEAALLAAMADEAPTDNFIRKHALAFQHSHGGDLADAALRVFGNAEGAYGANVNQLLESGAWRDEDELANAYVKRKGFAYGTDGRARRHDAVLHDVLARVEVTYQNLDSIELGVTSIDHYFDTLGGITRAAQRARGQRASVYVGDQTRGAGTIRSLAEQVDLETRTRALNPNWYEPLLAHGHEGVRHLEAHLTNTLGWSATTGQVDPWVYRSLAETFMLDPEMRARLAALNPAASTRIASRLLEAHERRYWEPDPESLEALRRAGDDLEDRLEGVRVGAVA